MGLDFDELDHGDDVGGDMPDDEAELFALFAEALDSATDVTVEGRAAEWRELFGQ